MRKIISLQLIIFSFLAPKIIFSQSLTAQEIYEKVNDAIVVIIAYDFEGKPIKQGSGVVINDSGLILTNYHVFSECEKLSVYHNNELINYSTIEVADVDNDILILKIYESKFKKIDIGNSENVKVGEQIYAIGSPLGYENTISEGIVSGLRNTDADNRNLIQITASISQGSSGGAIVNSKGELIGISTFQNKSGQNLNFAIPINEVLKLTNESANDPKTKEANNNFYKGYNAYIAKNYQDAIFYYTAYMKLIDNSSSCYYNLGLCYKKLEEYEHAIKYFNKAIELDPELIDALIARGNTFNDSQLYQSAIEDFNRALLIDDSYESIYKGRGESYLYQSKYKEALQDFNKALAINEEYIQVYYDKGLVYYEMSDYNGAITEFTKAINLFPTYYNAFYYRGRANNMLNKYDLAILDFDKCIELIPDDQYSYNNLGWVYFDIKNYKQAIYNLGKCYELDPENWDALLGISLTLYINDEQKKAKQFFKEAARIEPRLKKGMKGIESLIKEGYFYTPLQKKMLKVYFDEIL